MGKIQSTGKDIDRQRPAILTSNEPPDAVGQGPFSLRHRRYGKGICGHPSPLHRRWWLQTTYLDWPNGDR